MTTNYIDIPTELREKPLWLQYYLSPDPKRPDKKPRKHPEVKYATPEDRKANLRTLDHLLANRQLSRSGGGYQRWVDKSEGFTYVDLDRVRNPETAEIQEWALNLIRELDTYCEVSASGKGFHLVLRATLPRDYHKDPDQVEIYSGNIPNKLVALTGEVYSFCLEIKDRQEQADSLLKRAEAREFNKEAPLASERQLPSVDVPDPSYWREVFHLGSELDPKPGRIFIKGFLEEGITAIGSLSGVGKTWIGLSISHALISGEPLFGRFPVQEKANVLYLVPEMGGRKFRERMRKMRIAMDGLFFCQTVRDGACDLSDPFLLEAVKDMRPVIILDTAIRFQTGDENLSTDQAQGLGARLFNLINHGAASVICMHHRSKGAAGMEMTLENALRGSGDFGAMSDCVWGVEHARLRKGKDGDPDDYLKESQNLTRLYLECVKPRDMEPADPFVIQGRPYIDEKGDFVVLSEREEPDTKRNDDKDAAIRELAEIQPTIGLKGICRKLGVGSDRVYRVLNAVGLELHNGKWVPKETGLSPGLPDAAP